MFSKERQNSVKKGFFLVEHKSILTNKMMDTSNFGGSLRPNRSTYEFKIACVLGVICQRKSMIF